MNINEKIKQRRLQLGLNANDVAEALGISRATLYRYESHEIEKLPISVVEPLAEILGTTPGIFRWSARLPAAVRYWRRKT